MVVFEENSLYFGKVVRFVQNLCFGEKWLYLPLSQIGGILGKLVVSWASKMAIIGLIIWLA